MIEGTNCEYIKWIFDTFIISEKERLYYEAEACRKGATDTLFVPKELTTYHVCEEHAHYLVEKRGSLFPGEVVRAPFPREKQAPA